MGPNVFLVSAMLGEEDRFTSHWHYLLDVHPEIGQLVVDHIAATAGLEPSVYLGADDHPVYSRTDLPDFRLRCADYDLVCEHKLDSDLGFRQLERYCELVSEKPMHVVFISRNPKVIPGEVLAHARYRGPDRGIRHYLWEDFHGIVNSASGRVARDFALHMERLGMKRWQVGEFGDPFVAADATERFRRLWDPVIDRMRGPGRVVRRDSVGMGLQIQQPDGFHLFWIGPEKLPKMAEERLAGPVMELLVYDHQTTAAPSVLDPSNGELRCGAEPIFFLTPQEPRREGEYLLRRQYVAQLGPMLAGEAHDVQRRLVDFVATVVDHLGASRQ